MAGGGMWRGNRYGSTKPKTPSSVRPRQEVGRTPPRINNYLTLAIFVPFQQVKQELEEVYSYLYEETVKQSIGSYEIVWSLEEQ